MADDLWSRLIPPPGADVVRDALEHVRGRAQSRRSEAAHRRRFLALAAGLVLTFAAGWMAGQATPGAGARFVWALGGHSIEESRATFVAVPATNQ